MDTLADAMGPGHEAEGGKRFIVLLGFMKRNLEHHLTAALDARVRAARARVAGSASGAELARGDGEV
ncbi:hypothetical protein SPAR_13290 [Streptomyces sparsogenes DSM 40356]|uniref:Uncharacterized protein n=1 Tax=Streptomyces sparsogenes DSM 40356 TaxID=1331668 RepID=A0A1R1SL16_9ACTN|nr:hypothetical protein SPAR_13290 [Streptomyces sparsogenes DSM 40356]